MGVLVSIKMKLGLNLPVNNVSFGQTSTLLLRTIFEREQKGDNSLDVYLFPIGNVDISSQKEDKNFEAWLQNKIIKSFESYNRDIPVFKLWHLNGSLESFSKNQTLLTFYELNRPTKIELNIAKNNKLCLSSKYACDVFKMFGVECEYVPLCFDSFNFKQINKQFHSDGRIVFNLCGKFEKRKHHGKIIRAWIKKFGGNKNYVLQCAVYNPFLNEQQNGAMLGQALGGQKPFNVVFFPMMKENAAYNEFLNSGNVIIGMSGGEGWGLPEFHSIALGKHGVILNAHAYRSWATKENATLVNATDLIDSADGMFFKQGEMFNQGSIFDWNEDEFIAGCEKAIEKFNQNPVNSEGLKLQEEYTNQKFLDNIIKITS